MSENIRTSFSEDLKRLRHDILTMATKVEEGLGKALFALQNNDIELAREVRSGDEMVDAMQFKIEDEAAIIIATQQPVARDLRELVTIFKLTSNIERAGDYAVHLARIVKKLSKLEIPYRVQEHLERMSATGQEMLRSAISAYLARDTEAARKTAALDSVIDDEHRILVEDILGLIKKNPKLAKKAIKIFSASNYLERLGDHITNMCEAIIYLVEGKHEDLNE